jgi:hypothetical protein
MSAIVMPQRRDKRSLVQALHFLGFGGNRMTSSWQIGGGASYVRRFRQAIHEIDISNANIMNAMLANAVFVHVLLLMKNRMLAAAFHKPVAL